MSDPKRYLIDERDMEPERSLVLYRTILAWAATRGDRFVLRLQRDIYDDPNDLTRLCSLGQMMAAPVPEVPENIIQVEGTPDKAFVQELTSKAAPRRAISGDVSPVEDVMVLIGERVLYGSYDYGRDQVLDLTDEKLENLRQILKRAGFDPARVTPAPPYIFPIHHDETK